MSRRWGEVLRGVVALVGLGAGISGCSGMLVMPDNAPLKVCAASSDCPRGSVCDVATTKCVVSKGPCSKDMMDGDCDSGFICTSGVCLCNTSACCPTPPCTERCNIDPPTLTCGLDQYCETNGTCVSIPIEVCTPLTPSAPCASGGECCEGGSVCCRTTDRCQAGHCVPIMQPCSKQYPTGVCQAGFYCLGGSCFEIGALCDSAHLTGHCSDPSTECINGVCVPRSCGVDQQGPCPADYYCDIVQGKCVQLPCSIEHPKGSCPSPTTQKCSYAGTCIPKDSCLIGKDCPLPLLQYCSSGSQTCLSNGTCNSNADCEVDQATGYGAGFECDGNHRCVARTICNTDTAPCIPTQKCSVNHNCLAAGKCEATPDCPSPTTQYCNTTGDCLDDTTCKVTADCLILQPNTFCGGTAVPKHCFPVGQCFTEADCPPSNTCIGATASTAGTCQPSNVGQCSSNTFTTSGCPAGALSCCAPGGTCCSSGVCSLTQGNCIPFGQCAVDADCLGGAYTKCVNYFCVPTNTDCATCTATEQCTTVKDAQGAYVSGCIPKARCMTDSNCPLGEKCDASYHCQVDPGCGFETMAVGGAIQPNVLVVVDRSGSMDLCGAANSNTARCGYLSGSCTSSTCSDTGAFCAQASDCPGGTCSSGGCTGAGETCFNTFRCTAGTTSGTCGTPSGPACAIGGTPCTGGVTCIAKSCTLSSACGTGGVCTPGASGQCWNPSCVYGMCTNDGPCSTDANCGSLDTCYYPGRCVSGPNALNVCGSDSDCPLGTCGKSTCVGGSNPGTVCLVSTDCTGGTCTPVSGQGFCTTPSCIKPRWDQAQSAIKYVTDNYKTRINFGLAIFPRAHRPCTTTTDCAGCSNPTGVPYAGTCQDLCTQSCRYTTCLGGNSNDQPGVIEVPIAPAANQNDQQNAILAALTATDPGGATPTAPTLRGISRLANRGGLAATDRANAVLLVTDGEATGDRATVKVCAPPCSDGVKNGDETDTDCGGSCAPCADTKACIVADDCTNRVCRLGACRVATCANDTKDGDETDVDCGGSCGPCADGKGCTIAGDCASKLCTGTCAVATCIDAQQNGNETDVDCGGSCATATPTPFKCITGKKCLVGGDCLTGVCQAGLCRPTSCSDNTLSTGETDVDCGGSTCGPCLGGQTCAAGTDCVGGLCDTATHQCVSPSCADGRKDGTESGVDCGGTACGPCDPGQACVVPADCKSGICTANVCASPNCGDGVRNGDETGTDCGGTCGTCDTSPTAPACINASPAVTSKKACTPYGYDTACTSDADCASGARACIRGYCAAPCTVATDCATGTCVKGVCANTHCTNGSLDPSESDVDCGGSECPPCYTGGCKSNGDCVSGVCNGTSCAAPYCSPADGVKNGVETDVDCGGTGCPTCGTGKSCKLSTDCTSGICETGKCQAPRCGPAGSGLPRCMPFQICSSGPDCVGVSGTCQDYSDNNPLSTPGNTPVKQAALVNAAIGHLYASDPKVKTFVIGFNLGSTSQNLNCHAVYGRSARRDQGNCGSITPANCSTATAACYYDANDQTSLQTAFQDIVKAVASCSYDLTGTTVGSWPDGYYIYLVEGTTRTRVDQFTSWTISGDRLVFSGTACSKIQSGVAAPLIIKRCPYIPG